MQYTKQLFDKTISILVNSYLNGTLVSNNCYACAVGNMIAAGMNYRYKPCLQESRKVKWEHIIGDSYYDFERTELFDWYDVVVNGDAINDERVEKEIKSTGYAVDDLYRIEHAFESKHHTEDPMFNGLMAVVDVLCEIHGMNETEKKESKALFVKA